MDKERLKCDKPTSLFDCDTLKTVVADYDARIDLEQPFLRSSELLVLVLKLLMRGMLGVGIGGLQDLHIPHARQVLEEVPMPNEQTESDGLRFWNSFGMPGGKQPTLWASSWPATSN